MTQMINISRLGSMLFLIMLLAAPLRAEQGIDVELSFEKHRIRYKYEEPVLAKIRVHNTSNRPILINHGFQSLDVYLYLKIIDPAGRLLFPKRKIGRQTGTACQLSPLPYIQYKNEPIRVAYCEVLQKDYQNKDQATMDIRRYFPLILPGVYSIQVHIPATIFKGDVCNVNGDRWTGVFSSEQKYFFIDGGMKARIIPRKWIVSRLGDDQSKSGPYSLEDENGKLLSRVSIQVRYASGKTFSDYNPRSFYWNRTVPLHIERWQNGWFTATARADDCLENIAPLKAGPYLVGITGRLRNGMPLFGGLEIDIIEK